MAEEGFENKGDAEAAQLSVEQANKLRDRLAAFLPPEPAERNFWLWLLTRKNQ
jgi:hypothetical protein